MYASVGPGGRALLCWFLGPARLARISVPSSERRTKLGGRAMARKKVIDELVVIKLLKRAKSELDDPIEVNRLLREVGKFYDPMTGKAMIDGASRAQVIALIERGDKAEALAAIDQYIEND